MIKINLEKVATGSSYYRVKLDDNIIKSKLTYPESIEYLKDSFNEVLFDWYGNYHVVKDAQYNVVNNDDGSIVEKYDNLLDAYNYIYEHVNDKLDTISSYRQRIKGALDSYLDSLTYGSSKDTIKVDKEFIEQSIAKIRLLDDLKSEL